MLGSMAMNEEHRGVYVKHVSLIVSCYSLPLPKKFFEAENILRLHITFSNKVGAHAPQTPSYGTTTG